VSLFFSFTCDLSGSRLLILFPSPILSLKPFLTPHPFLFNIPLLRCLVIWSWLADLSFPSIVGAPRRVTAFSVFEEAYGAALHVPPFLNGLSCLLRIYYVRSVSLPVHPFGSVIQFQGPYSLTVTFQFSLVFLFSDSFSIELL